MRLARQGVEWWRLQITTAPAASGTWEASFDGGATWVAGSADVTDDSVTQWLVAGPDAGLATGPATVIPATLTPQLRLRHAPEVVIRTPLVPIVLT